MCWPTFKAEFHISQYQNALRIISDKSVPECIATNNFWLTRLWMSWEKCIVFNTE